MPREIGTPSDHDARSTSEPSGREPGLLEVGRLLQREIREIVHDHLVLAALETRQAGESLVSILVMSLITACLLSTAWLALVCAAVILLVQYTFLTPVSALVLVFAVHGLMAMLLVAAIRKRSKNLLFPATISRLKPATDDEPDTEHSP
jgi:uncharacterized membrane protein YqjE